MSDGTDAARVTVLSEVADRLESGLRHVRLDWVRDASAEIMDEVLEQARKALSEDPDREQADVEALAYRLAVEAIRARRHDRPPATGPQGPDLEQNLVEGLSRLEPPDRHAATLYLEGHTVAEVAILLGCKRSKANVIIHRAVAALRRHLLALEREE